MIEATTTIYMGRIDGAQRKLKANIDILKEKEQTMRGIFDTYKYSMESELDSTLQYLLHINTSTTLSAAATLQHPNNLNDKELDDYIQKCRRMILAEEFELQSLEAASASEDANSSSNSSDYTISFTKKLLDLSLEKPDIWRRMKEQEIELRLYEEARERNLIFEQQREAKTKLSEEINSMKSKDRESKVLDIAISDP